MQSLRETMALSSMSVMQNDEAIARSLQDQEQESESARRKHKRHENRKNGSTRGMAKASRHLRCQPARVPSRAPSPRRCRRRHPMRRSPVPRRLRSDAVQRVAAPARAVRPLRTAHRRGPADGCRAWPTTTTSAKRAPRRRPLRKSCQGRVLPPQGAGPGNDRASSERPRHRRGAGRGGNDFDGGMVWLRCRVGDAAAVEMMVDSGAQHLVISAPLARRLGLMNRLDRSEQGVAAGVGRARIIGSAIWRST